MLYPFNAVLWPIFHEFCIQPQYSEFWSALWQIVAGFFDSENHHVGSFVAKTMSSTPTTKVNMILRLADPDDQQAWGEFIEVYTPLLTETARRLGLNSHDASDAVQEVMAHLVSAINKWKPTGQRAGFRRWLGRVSRNQMLTLLQRTNVLRSEGVVNERQLRLLAQVTAPADPTATFDLAFRQQVFLFVIHKIQSDFQSKTWQAFWATYVDQTPPADVARQLSLSVGAVYIARSRVMNRLRETVEKLMDNEWESVTCVDRESFDERLYEIRTATTTTTADSETPSQFGPDDHHSVGDGDAVDDEI